MKENIHFQKGMDKINNNDFVAAIDLFTKAISIEPNNPFIYNQRAVAYLNMNQYELSMFDMNKSIELDEKYAYFYACRGFLKTKLQDLEGAVEDYEQSIELDPENEITYNNLGLVLEQMGSMQRAQKAFKKGNEILGYDPERKNKENEVADSAKSSKQNTFGQTDAQKPTACNDETTPQVSKKEMNKKKRALAKDVFSKKSTFKEFLGFIGRGFKLESKKNDEKGKS